MLKVTKQEKGTALKKNSGQALVEFVIILPIFLMILFVIIDFSNIYFEKNKLENDTKDIITYIKSGKDIKTIEKKLNIDIDIKDKNNTKEINISKKVNLITPFSNLVVDDPYEIKTKRVILNE